MRVLILGGTVFIGRRIALELLARGDDVMVVHRGQTEPAELSGCGSPEASFRFWFWPPVPMAARRIRVIVSTLREAAWAEIDIPGRPGPSS
jgi:nucleoside-diphosphate-sugar epimerase